MEKDITKNHTAGFFLMEGRRIAGAIVEATRVEGGWAFETYKLLTGEEFERFAKSTPEPVGRLRSASGRAELMVTPFLEVPACQLFMYLEKIELAFRRRLSNVASIRVNPSKIKS